MEFRALKILISNPQALVISVSVFVLYALEGRWVSHRENVQKRKKRQLLQEE